MNKDVTTNTLMEQEYEVFNFVDTAMCGDCRNCRQSSKCDFGTHLLAITYQVGGV